MSSELVSGSPRGGSPRGAAWVAAETAFLPFLLLPVQPYSKMR